MICVLYLFNDMTSNNDYCTKRCPSTITAQLLANHIISDSCGG